MRVCDPERLPGADFRGVARRVLPFGALAFPEADGARRFGAAASKAKVSCSPMPITPPEILARG
jgi:hypothetical protein